MWGRENLTSVEDLEQAKKKTDAVLSRVTVLVDRLYDNLDELSEVLDGLGPSDDEELPPPKDEDA